MTNFSINGSLTEECAIGAAGNETRLPKVQDTFVHPVKLSISTLNANHESAAWRFLVRSEAQTRRSGLATMHLTLAFPRDLLIGHLNLVNTRGKFHKPQKSHPSWIMYLFDIPMTRDSPCRTVEVETVTPGWQASHELLASLPAQWSYDWSYIRIKWLYQPTHPTHSKPNQPSI